MSNVSVTIITLNEESNLPACLDSVKWADEIIVVDSKSQDRTVEIAQNFGCKVFINPWTGHKEQKNVAVDQTSHEWVMSVDADEQLTPEIHREVCKIIADSKSLDGYTFPRKNFFLGKWMRYGGWHPDNVLRLFRKSKGRFSGINPHDKVVISSGLVGHIKYPIIHMTYTSITQYLIKQDLYSSIGAKELLKSNRFKNVSSLLLTGKLIGKFIETYILKLGILDGIHGLIASVGGAYFVMFRLARLWELQNKGNQ